RPAQLEDNVVKPALEKRHQRLAGVALAAGGQRKVAAELLFIDAVEALDLLLLAQAFPVRRNFSAPDQHIARRVIAPRDRALLRFAADAFQKQFHAFTAAQPALRPCVTTHLKKLSTRI